MLKWILLAGLAFVGCVNDSTAPAPSGVSPGIYDGTLIFSGLELKSQQVLGADKIYSFSVYNDCQILLRVGTWYQSGDSLIIPNAGTQGRGDCGAQMVQGNTSMTFSFLLRNVTDASFDLFYPPNPSNAAQWVTYRKI